MVQNSNFCRIMEAGSISKHGAGSSLMNRVNIQMRQMFPKFGKVVAAVSIAAMCMGSVHAQTESNKPPPSLVVVIDPDGKEKEYDYGNFNYYSIPLDGIFMMETFLDQEVIENYGEKAKNGVLLIIMKREQATKTDIPLIVVDGRASDITSITPASIDSISMLRDQKAIELFGEKGKNGVIIITTKQNHLVEDHPPVYIVDTKKMGKDDSIPLEIIGYISPVVASRDMHPRELESYIERYGEEVKNGIVRISLKYKKPPAID